MCSAILNGLQRIISSQQKHQKSLSGSREQIRKRSTNVESLMCLNSDDREWIVIMIILCIHS